MHRIYRMRLEQPCYHVTLWTFDGKNSLAKTCVAKSFIENMFLQQKLGSLLLFSFVVLHDHCHVILSPSSSCDINRCLVLLKSSLYSGLSPFWDNGRFFSEISSDEEFRETLERDFYDPVKLGLSVLGEQYPYSSANINYRYRVDLPKTGYLPKFVSIFPRGDDCHTGT